MRMAFCVLCVAMGSGIAGAQERLSNFEACVSEARQRHTDTTMENYLSYKCDGATAQRLAARPDQCAADVRPSLRNIERHSRQLDDGLYLRIIWRTEVCAGMCETRLYNDARDTSYLCEVRRHTDGRSARRSSPPLRDTLYDRRAADDAPPSPSGSEQPRRYYYQYYDDQPRYDDRLRALETEGERRLTGRWVYVEPGWRLEYRYPSEYYPDDRRDGYRSYEYRSDGARRDGYRGGY